MSLEQLIPYVTVCAIAGAGMVTGLLFAFSNFVMQSLAVLEPKDGIVAMQQINEKIINPIFLLFFLGTPLLCAVAAIYSLMNLNAVSSLFLLMGSVCYLLGPFGITIGFNVPLNDRLAKVEPKHGEEFWSEYQTKWQSWNHVRTYIGLLSMLLLGFGLASPS